MRRYFRLFKKNLTLELSADMAYKLNFFIKCLSLILGDAIGPLVIMLVYSASSGVPGWSFDQYLLFQGTYTLVFGLGHVFLFSLPYMIVEYVREGTFDSVLVKPYNPLLYLTFTSIDLEGLAEVFVGLFLIFLAKTKLGLDFFSVNGLYYLIFIALAMLFIYSMMILVGAISFLVVRAYALAMMFFNLMDFARYPLIIYNGGLRVILTFFVPVGIISYYPADTLLRGISLSGIIPLISSVIGFFLFTLVVWNFALKRHTSAGG